MICQNPLPVEKQRFENLARLINTQNQLLLLYSLCQNLGKPFLIIFINPTPVIPLSFEGEPRYQTIQKPRKKAKN